MYLTGAYSVQITPITNIKSYEIFQVKGPFCEVKRPIIGYIRHWLLNKMCFCIQSVCYNCQKVCIYMYLRGKRVVFCVLIFAPRPFVYITRISLAVNINLSRSSTVTWPNTTPNTVVTWWPQPAQLLKVGHLRSPATILSSLLWKRSVSSVMGSMKKFPDTPSRREATVLSRRDSDAKRARIGDEKSRWAVKRAENLHTDAQVDHLLLDTWQVRRQTAPYMAKKLPGFPILSHTNWSLFANMQLLSHFPNVR